MSKSGLQSLLFAPAGAVAGEDEALLKATKALLGGRLPPSNATGPRTNRARNCCRRAADRGSDKLARVEHQTSVRNLLILKLNLILALIINSSLIASLANQQQQQLQQQQPPHRPSGHLIHFNLSTNSAGHQPAQQTNASQHHNQLALHLNNRALMHWLENQRRQQQHHQKAWNPLHRTSSSSAVLSENEDLQDSSIRTRIGSIQPNFDDSASQQQSQSSNFISHTSSTLNPNSDDFDNLISSILKQVEWRQKQQQTPSLVMNPKASADANNKTSMRFFRNNKTFASIVYTNSQLLDESNNRVVRQPRRLINCHLVDLEKHSSDVAVFESKYDIKTADIEFNDMMYLIDQCTNIARFKPLRPFQTNLKPNVAQMFAAALPAGGGAPSAANAQARHEHGPAKALGQPIRPFMVVGRPIPISPSTAANSHSTFHTVMSGALNNELRKLAPIQNDSNKLELPGAGEANGGGAGPMNTQPRVQRRTSPTDPNKATRQQRALIDHQQHPAAALANNLIAKAAETSKKLVLGEVTPSPAVVGSQQGGIKEALQEITSYDTTDLLAIWRGILPGTNWCGMGDRATSYNDLGFESDIDICCRAHDFCPIRLSAFSGGYGLFNWSFYTRSHCWCDQNFLDCLQRAQSPLSAVVMKFYFTIMKTTCLHDNETSIATSTLANYRQDKQQLQKPQQLFENSLNQRQPQMFLAELTNGPQNQREQQQRLLLDQIRAALPIPAFKQSQVLESRVETKSSRAA